METWRFGALGLAMLACGPRDVVHPVRSSAVAVDRGAPPAEDEDGYRYCTATVDHWGVPSCIGEITAEQQRHRGLVTRLVVRSGRVARIDTINSRLAMYWESPTVTSVELVYEGARVVERIGLDRNGIVRTRQRFSDDGSVRWLDSVGRPRPDDESSVSGAEQSFDEQGRVIELRYVDATGAPATRTNGVSTVRYAYGDNGLAEDESYFNRDGTPQTNKQGIHRTQTVFDSRGLELTRQHLDVAGAPRPDKEGVQLIRDTYDVHGNLVEESHHDEQGKLHLTEDIAICRIKRDAWGQEVEMSFFDDEGKPVISSFNYVTRRRVLNAKGLPIEWSFFDADGKPALVRGQAHSIRRRVLNSRDRSIQESSFDTDGSPVTTQGTQQNVLTYDERDNLIERTWLTESGAVTVAGHGYFSILRQTFDVDRLLRKDYLDELGNPHPIRGSAGVIFVFDELGVAKEIKLDAEGNPPPAQ